MKGLSGVVGGYQVLGHWASGPMSEVYAIGGEGLPDARTVYALTVRPKSTMAARVAEQVVSDARSIKGTWPRALARTYDAFELEGHLCLITDFAPGETLAQLLAAAGGPLLPLTAIAIAIELGTALNEAHLLTESGGRPWVHGDLCPENVIIGYDGRVKILDFGRALTEARLSQDPRVGGPHPGYFSPERALAVRDIHPKSDIYSLGLILYEMLAGTPANDASDDAARIERAQRPKIPPLSSKARIGELLDAAIKKALLVDPAGRFSSAGRFAEALATLKSGRLSTWNSRLELEKLVLHHFSHRSRAMGTLMSRWSAQIASAPTGDLPAPAHLPALRKTSKASLRGASMPRATSAASLPAMPLAEPIVTLDVQQQAPTGDLEGPSSAHLPLLPRRKLSFVTGLLLCLVGALVVSASAPFWPAHTQAIFLKVAGPFGEAASIVWRGIARLLTDLANGA